MWHKKIVATKINNKPKQSESLLSYYFRCIGKYPRLSKAEEAALFEEVKNLSSKNERAKEIRDMIIKANLFLVVSIAYKYKHSGYPLEDLIQFGNYGLLLAFEKFDYSRGNRFSTYATSKINGAIKDALPLIEKIRLSKNAKRAVKDYREAANYIAGLKNSTYVSEKEIRDFLGWTAEKIQTVTNSIYEITSLDVLISADKEAPNALIDIVTDTRYVLPEEELMANFELTELRKALNEVLDDAEKKIVQLYFGFCGKEPLSQEKIASSLGISPARVSQIIQKAKRKLHNYYHPEYIKYERRKRYSHLVDERYFIQSLMKDEANQKIISELLTESEFRIIKILAEGNPDVPKKIKDIAIALEISPSSISQVKIKAVEKLYAFFK